MDAKAIVIGLVRPSDHLRLIPAAVYTKTKVICETQVHARRGFPCHSDH